MRLPALFLLLLVSAAGAEEVVETYEDGSVKAKYAVDEEGRKSGSYVAFWPSGKVARRAFYRRDLIEGSERTFDEAGRARTQAVYRRGLLHGRFHAWDAAGKPAAVASYADGKLDGKRELFRAGELVSTQVWRGGQLVSLEGVAVLPRPEGEIRRTITAILAGRTQAPDRGRRIATAGTGSETDRASALRRLMAYRYLCGLPHEEMSLGEHQNRHAEAAAMVCSKLGRLTHEPPNPGLAKPDYEAAVLGARNCNLGHGTAAASVDGYMDDSDPSNIDRLGHRRWCLNPPMRITGFGTAAAADGHVYTAMLATDASGVGTAPDSVCFPPSGWVPVDFFGGGYAWSVSFAAGGVPAPAAVTVVVHELDRDYVRSGAPLELDYFRVSDKEFGMPHCVIFRPKGVRVEPGAAYWVEVSCPDPGVKKRRAALRYLVQFAAPVLGGAAEAGGASDE